MHIYKHKIYLDIHTYKYNIYYVIYVAIYINIYCDGNDLM